MRFTFMEFTVFVLIAAALLLSTQNTYARQGAAFVTPQIAGKTADGRYNVYRVEGGLDDFQYTGTIGGQSYMWTDVDLYNHLPRVNRKDIDGKNIRCNNAVCFDRAGHLIGAAPKL